MTMMNKLDPRAMAALRQAVVLHAGGKLEEARALYQKVLRWHPQHSHTGYLLGVIALQTQRPDMAADLIGKAIPNLADNPEAHVHYGMALHQLGKFEAAIKNYDCAI